MLLWIIGSKSLPFLLPPPPLPKQLENTVSHCTSGKIFSIKGGFCSVCYVGEGGRDLWEPHPSIMSPSYPWPCTDFLVSFLSRFLSIWQPIYMYTEYKYLVYFNCPQRSSWNPFKIVGYSKHKDTLCTTLIFTNKQSWRNIWIKFYCNCVTTWFFAILLCGCFNGRMLRQVCDQLSFIFLVYAPVALFF